MTSFLQILDLRVVFSVYSGFLLLWGQEYQPSSSLNAGQKALVFFEQTIVGGLVFVYFKTKSVKIIVEE